LNPSYLLDTHAAIWLLEGNANLGTNARTLLDAQDLVAISDITLLEIAMLAARGVITLKPDVNIGLQTFADKLVVLPITARIAKNATTIALPHRDPFDRVIAATAIAHDLVLVTNDRQIVDSNVVSTVW